MKIEQVDPTAVEIPHRLRAVDPAKVKQLAESMAAIGLQQPVTVWMPTDGNLELVAGAHRVKAACDLGWDWIDCIFADGMTDIDRQLWEIDENLMRAELNPTELGEHITRREKLWAEREIQVAKVEPPEKSAGYKSPPKQKKGFAASTAAATGMSKAAINLALSRTKAIPADVRDQIKGTKLDTGTYLDWLKGMDPDDQRAQVKTDLAEGVKPKIPKKATAPDVDAEQEAFKRLWGGWSTGHRKWIKAWLQDK